jgi:hypothetical protein
MGDEHVEFLEAALVKQKLDPLARRQLALGVLRCDPLFAPTGAGDGTACFKFCKDILHRSPLTDARGNLGEGGTSEKHETENLQI